MKPTMGDSGLIIAPALVNIQKKSLTNPSAEDEAITRVMRLSAGTDRFLPIWFGGRVIGYSQASRNSHDVTFYRLPVGTKPLPLGAAGISTYDDIISSLSAGRGYRANFSKGHTSTPVQSNFSDLWPVAGFPGAGAYGGTALTAKQFTDSTAGALYLNGNVQTTYNKFLLGAAAVGSAAQATLILYDRVLTWETCSFSTSSQNFVNTLTAQRYVGPGPGLTIAVTAQTVLGATASQISTMTYVNQAGTGGQTSPTTRALFVIISAAVPSTTNGARLVCPIDTGGTIPWSQYLPLAAGDTGVSSLTNFQCSAANTGSLCFVGLREMMWIPLGTAGLPTQIDNILQIGGLDRIYDGACMSLMAYWSAATAVTFSGYVKAVWN